MGEGTRLAAATGAWICFEDEAGQNLRPSKARTWAPRGHTPVVRVCGKGSGRVSVAGLVCLKPGARGHLFYRVRVHRGRKGERRSMSEADYAGLIAAAHKELHAPSGSRDALPRPCPLRTVRATRRGTRLKQAARVLRVEVRVSCAGGLAGPVGRMRAQGGFGLRRQGRVARGE